MGVKETCVVPEKVLLTEKPCFDLTGGPKRFP